MGLKPVTFMQGSRPHSTNVDDEMSKCFARFFYCQLGDFPVKYSFGQAFLEVEAW